MLVACSKRLHLMWGFWPYMPIQSEDSIQYLGFFKHWRGHPSCLSHRNNTGGWRIVRECVHNAPLFIKVPLETSNITSNRDFYGSGQGKDHLRPVIVDHWYRYLFLSSHTIQYAEHVAWKNIIKHMQARDLISMPFRWTPDTHCTHTHTHFLFTVPPLCETCKCFMFDTQLKTALAPSLVIHII